MKPSQPEPHVTINVTEEDIRVGKRESVTRCAIARAAKRALKRTNIEVTGNGICVGDNFLPDYLIPQKAFTFMDRFDDGKEVKPISFVAKYVGQQV